MQVRSLLGDTSDQNSAIQKQVLNLYDQLYQSYVLANTSTLEVDHTPEMKDGDLLNELQIVVMENLEIVFSVCARIVFHQMLYCARARVCVCVCVCVCRC